MKEITFKISRYKPGIIDPARFYTYTVAADEQLSVLDGLEQIRLQQEPTLVYRHSCHHSSCGTCACIINGSEKLACTTKVLDLGSPVVTLEPLNGFERIADLAVNADTFFQEISPDWRFHTMKHTAGLKTASNAEAACRPVRFRRPGRNSPVRPPWQPFTVKSQNHRQRKNSC